MSRLVRTTIAVVMFVTALLAPACGHPTPRGKPVGIHAAETPRVVWRWRAPPPADVGAPAVEGDEVACTYGHHRLVLLDGDGHERWETEHAGLRDVAPRLTPDLVIAAGDEGVAAFDRANGGIRWRADLGERASTPVVAAAAAVVFVTTWEGSVVALDTASGHVRWRQPLPGPALGPPAAGAGVVVAIWERDDSSAAGAVAVDAADGRQRWQVSLPPGGVGAPSVATGVAVAVAVAGDGRAHALDLGTGTERWTAPVDGAGSPEVAPLAAGGDSLVVSDRLSGLTLLDTREGRVRWHQSGPGAVVRGAPVVASTAAGLRIALPLDDGRLWLVGPRGPTRVIGGEGRVSGLAVLGRLLVVARREAAVNGLDATWGW